MGSKTKATKTPYENNIEYMNWTPPDTADIQAVRGAEDMPESLQPALQAQFDRAQQRNSNRLNSSYNQNIPQVARLAMQQQGERDLTADYGAALGQSAFDAKNAALQRKMFLASLTAPRPLQSKTSGYGTQVTQTPGLLNSIIGGASTIAGGFLAGR